MNLYLPPDKNGYLTTREDINKNREAISLESEYSKLYEKCPSITNKDFTLIILENPSAIKEGKGLLILPYQKYRQVCHFLNGFNKTGIKTCFNEFVTANRTFIKCFYESDLKNPIEGICVFLYEKNIPISKKDEILRIRQIETDSSAELFPWLIVSFFKENPIIIIDY